MRNEMEMLTHGSAHEVLQVRVEVEDPNRHRTGALPERSNLQSV
jgi:hypothetical protein